MQGSKSFNTNYRDVFLLRLQFEKDTIVRGVGLPVCPFLSPVAAAVACRRKDDEELRPTARDRQHRKDYSS